MPTNSKKWFVLGLLVVAAAYPAQKFARSRVEGVPLSIRWEGAVISRNNRDLGGSLNECLGREEFRTGKIWRSNVWFSGWSCDSVGNPDVIYSLNHDPKRNERYFCERADGSANIGRYFSDDVVLNDLEFLATWNDPRNAEAACAFLKDSFETLASDRKILVHCDVGRDRTGTYAALVAAMAAEAHGRLDERMLDAIECDYRKTKKLEPAKQGRMRHFIEQLVATGGVQSFLTKTCGIDASRLPVVADAVMH